MNTEIDVDKLREQSASRRSTVSNDTPLWQCAYCKRGFIHESSFMNHVCKEMRRYNDLRSQTGVSAYSLYGEWMKLKKYKIPSVDAFATSKFFTSFYKFAEHIKKINLGKPDTFMRLMVERDISPTIWTRSQCYAIYLEFYDKMQDPMEQVISSIEYLFKISEQENVELSNIFNHIGIHRLAEMVSLRMVTPWLLFCSKTFGIFLKTVSTDDWEVLQIVINPAYWAEKLEGNPILVSEIIVASNDVGL
jgi:hypothetical protein